MKHEELVNRVAPDRPWYAVKYLLKETRNKYYQEDTVLVMANSQNEALKKGEKIAQDYCESMSEYEYTGYAEVFHVFESSLAEGIEVYSTIRKSDLNAKEYIRGFLRTGTEEGFTKDFE